MGDAPEDCEPDDEPDDEAPEVVVAEDDAADELEVACHHVAFVVRRQTTWGKQESSYESSCGGVELGRLVSRAGRGGRRERFVGDPKSAREDETPYFGICDIRKWLT